MHYNTNGSIIIIILIMKRINNYNKYYYVHKMNKKGLCRYADEERT